LVSFCMIDVGRPARACPTHLACPLTWPARSLGLPELYPSCAWQHLQCLTAVIFTGCMSESEELGNGLRLAWNETAINVTVTQDCPCIQARASRTCGGNDGMVGSWINKNSSACQLDSLTVELCNAAVSRTGRQVIVSQACQYSTEY